MSFKNLLSTIIEARRIGVPEAMINRTLRQNAMRSRDAQTRGALLSAGLEASNIASRNQAGLITQAGQRQAAFTPGTGAGAALGRGALGAAEAEAQYQDELGRIDQASFDRQEQARIKAENLAREDALREERWAREDQQLADERAYDEQKALAEDADTNKEVNNKAIELANRAKMLIGPASQAGDLINGFVELDDLSTEEKGWLDAAEQAVSGVAQTLAGGFQQTRAIRNEARERIAAARYPNSYNAYTRLRTIANQMVFPILESGALGVNPTDADVDLARKATFNIEAPSNTWMNQLSDIIAKAKGEELVSAQFDGVQEQKKLPDNPPPGTGTQQSATAESVINKGWKLLTE